MSYGFEVRGPGGQLWLNSSDLTTRFIGVWQLNGTSGTINNSLIVPGRTSHHIMVSHYFTSDTVGTRFDPDSRTMLYQGDITYIPRVNVSIGTGSVTWTSDAVFSFFNSNVQNRAYLYLFRTG